MKSILYIYLFLISVNSIYTQEIITDLGIYAPPPPPVLPAAGGVIIDPVFGTEILRVTDENDGNDNEHGYSYWPCFNMDNSMIYIYRVSGFATIYDLDTTAFTISNKREAFTNLIDGEYPIGEDQIWSRTDKNILYCHTTKKLVAYNVADQTFEIIKDFDGIIPDNNIINQMSCNEDATKFAFSKKQVPGYQIVGYFVWDSSTDSIYDVESTDVDEVQLDRTGNYLWVKTSLSGAGVFQAYVTDLSTNSTTGLTDDGPDYAPGHGDVGHEFIIGYENWNNRILKRTCADPHTFSEIWNFEGDWNQDMHISLLAENEDWVLVSCYLAGPTFPFTGLFENEIFQIATDGSKQVRRLGHHQSNYLISGGNYWSSPRASMSYTGDYVMFTSNWGDATRTDVFILKIPSEQDTIISGIKNDLVLKQIYPNPAIEILNIELGFDLAKVNILIYDMLGKLWINKEFSYGDINLDVKILPAGMFDCTIIINEKTETVKFVKSN